LAGESAAAYATVACIAAVYDWQWHDAALGYQRAINASPDEPSAHHWYAINYLVPLRRFEEAEIELQRAVDADPLSMPIRASVGMRSYFAHDFGRAARELRECLDLDPGSTTARLFLGLTLVELKRFDDALLELGTASQMASSPEITAAMAYAHGRAGHSDHARGLLNSLTTLAEQRYVSASLIAQVQAGLGAIDAAADALHSACDHHATDLAWLGVRPVFDGLRADPRFEALLTRMRL
jgi:serine/threonine-protein kinase